MKSKTILLSLLTITLGTTHAQTYIGQILHRNAYTYAKLVCENDTCTFSLPYLDGDESFSVPLAISTTQKWQITRDAAVWKFNTDVENGLLTGSINNPAGQQEIKFFEQKPALESSHLTSYKGVYEDQEKRRVIIYTRYNYLHIISPYSEETMSLKPIEENTFWSVSGERSVFSNAKDGVFNNLTIHVSEKQDHKLKRLPDMTVEDLWIPVGLDTIYARLFLPQSNEPVPACLVLPGGGAVGMDNYIYEARLFAAHGIAALVFDKSGNGNSKGPGNFRQQSFEEKNEQYISLFRFLQDHPKISPSKVGVHGPSEGGRLALMMAIDLNDALAFAIATAGPFMTLHEGQLYAMDHHHRNMDVDEVDNMHIRQIWDDYYNGITKGEINQEIIDRANVYRAKNNRLFLPPDYTGLPSSPYSDDIENDRVVTEAGNISCPVLLQYGENDQRVNPQKSLRNLMPQLSHPENVETIIYKRGGHNMMTPEYKICTGYTSDKINWLKQIGMIQ